MKPTLVALLAAALGLAGCSKQEPGSTASTGTEPKKLTLAFVTNNASDFWTIARKGVEKADEELDNVEV